MVDLTTQPMPSVPAPFYWGSIAARSVASGTRDQILYTFVGRSVWEQREVVSITGLKNSACRNANILLDAAPVGAPAYVWYRPDVDANAPWVLHTEVNIQTEDC